MSLTSIGLWRWRIGACLVVLKMIVLVMSSVIVVMVRQELAA